MGLRSLDGASEEMIAWGMAKGVSVCMDAWLTLVVIGAPAWVLTLDLLAPALAILGATVLLMVCGGAPPRQASSRPTSPNPTPGLLEGTFPTLRFPP